MFKYGTIQKKLRLLALVSSLGGLLIVSMALTFYDQYTAKQALRSELTVIGKLVANRTAAAIVFDDRKLAERNLSHMQVHGSITSACIILRSGNVFASFQRQGTPIESCPLRAVRNPSSVSTSSYYDTLEGQGLIFSEPIVYNGNRIGDVVFRANLDELADRIINFAATAIGIAFVTGMLVFLFTSRIQNSIGKPLLQLTNVVRHIGEHRDYSVRAEKVSDDELGEMVDAFNSMLQTIEHQNEVMNQSSQDLRKLVRKKTEAETRLASILDSAPDAVITASDTYLIQSVNAITKSLFQWQETEMIGRKLSLLLPDLRGPQMLQLIDELPKIYELQGERRDHTVFPLELSVSQSVVDGRKMYTCTLRDVSFRKQTEQQIRMLSLAIEQSPSSVVITDDKGTVQYMNSRFEEIVGMKEAGFIDRFPSLFQSNIDAGGELSQVMEQLASGQECRVEVKNQMPNGESFWESVVFSSIIDGSGKLTHVIRSSEDISIRKTQEEKLVHQANFDPLTDLPNRSMANDRLQQALAQAKRGNKSAVVMFVDLDRFKYVNDTFGHDAGDMLLIEAASRLTACIREECTVARLGGDEFLIILPNVDDPVHSESVAQRIITSFNQPFLISQQDFVVTASIGVAVYPSDGKDAEEIMSNADKAMYRAKELGRSGFEFYTKEMNEKASERIKIESLLRTAVSFEETYLLFQPIVEPQSGTMLGVEALLRWHSKEIGLVMPDQFISVAEDSDLILEIGNWVITEACRQLRQWETEGLKGLSMSVNVSARQFKEVGIIEVVERALDTYQIDAGRLQLEVRETILLENAPMVSIVVDRLKEVGVKLAVDDFGTGYSALSYLQQYPFDVLKIDRSFIRYIEKSEQDAALCNAIITMAHSLDLRVIGEGVENQEQLSILTRAKCDMVQGYCFAEPLAAAEVLAFAEMIDSPTLDLERD